MDLNQWPLDFQSNALTNWAILIKTSQKGFEPLTSWLTVICYTKLSYWEKNYQTDLKTPGKNPNNALRLKLFLESLNLLKTDLELLESKQRFLIVTIDL